LKGPRQSGGFFYWRTTGGMRTAAGGSSRGADRRRDRLTAGAQAPRVSSDRRERQSPPLRQYLKGPRSMGAFLLADRRGDENRRRGFEPRSRQATRQADRRRVGAACQQRAGRAAIPPSPPVLERPPPKRGLFLLADRRGDENRRRGFEPRSRQATRQADRRRAGAACQQ
jgi:hypothetical protein